MENETTTPAATQDTGVDTSTQPEEQPAEAVTTTPSEPISTDLTDEQPDTVETTTTDEPESSSSDDINAWLSKKGIDPTSPEAMAKVAEMARNSEKLMSKATQQRAAAQRELTDAFQNNADPNTNAYLEGEVQTLKMKDLARDFVSTHPDIVGPELTNFAGYIKENPAFETLAQAGVLTLDQVHAMYQNSPAQADKLKEQGGQEALKKLANRQRATSVSGAASSPSPSKAKAEDAFLQGFNNPF